MENQHHHSLSTSQCVFNGAHSCVHGMLNKLASYPFYTKLPLLVPSLCSPKFAEIYSVISLIVPYKVLPFNEIISY